MATEIKNDAYYLDSDYNNYMTRDKSIFVDLDDSIKPEVKMRNRV